MEMFLTMLAAVYFGNLLFALFILRKLPDIARRSFTHAMKPATADRMGPSISVRIRSPPRAISRRDSKARSLVAEFRHQPVAVVQQARPVPLSSKVDHHVSELEARL
jgi:hypothetical protein